MGFTALGNSDRYMDTYSNSQPDDEDGSEEAAWLAMIYLGRRFNIRSAEQRRAE